jgi:ADP-heptose:LPS heptosyltransferase
LLPIGEDLVGYESLNHRYITIHDGWDAQLMMGDHRPTKSYPVGRWTSLVCAIKKRFPEVSIVQLGGAAGAEIPGVDISLKGAIGLAMAAKVLAKSAIHIDTDSGLVHIAASLGTRAVVLFGPTDIAYFGYTDNTNINASGCNNCWLGSGSWITTCLIGDRVPRCMLSIQQQPILDAIGAVLENHAAGS